MGQPLLEVGDVATVLGVSRWSIYRWAQMGRIPCVRAGRKLRFELDAVLAALRDEGRRGETEQQPTTPSLDRKRRSNRRVPSATTRAQFQSCGEMPQEHIERIRAAVAATHALGEP